VPVLKRETTVLGGRRKKESPKTRRAELRERGGPDEKE